MSDAYAKAGVDYTKIRPFKRRMVEVVRATQQFPESRDVYVDDQGCYEYRGPHPHKWKQVTEGLGNKNVLAEIFYRLTGKLKFDAIALDNMRMAFNDVAAQGAMPVTYTDEVATGNSEWFSDVARGHAMAQGFLEGCEHDHVALVGGESPSLRFLVKDYPVMSGCAVGIIAPATRQIDNANIEPGLAIIGAAASGLHSNGASLPLDRMVHQDLMRSMPSGKVFLEELLTPTISYARLVETLQDAGIQISGIVPGTGGGLAKLLEAVPARMNFLIRRWPAVPEVLLYMRHMFGLGTKTCLQTFNWGVGYYLFVDLFSVSKVCELGRAAGYTMIHLGDTVKGAHRVHFVPENISLDPPS